MRSLILSLCVASLLSGCMSSGGGGLREADEMEDPAPEMNDPEAEPLPEDDPPRGRVSLQGCHSAPLPSGLAIRDWNHLTSSVVTAAGDPNHSAQDIITTDTRGALIPGKFTYGLISKDLEDEAVEVWMDDCSGAYVKLGETVTDDDGRIAFMIEKGELPGVGSYGLYLRVSGDDSGTISTLRVLPEGSKIVVFDIDATLTTDDIELFEDIASDFFEPISSGEHDPEARAGAQEITQLRFEQGYVVVYLTGRPYWLTAQSRDWLRDHDMAPGNLHLTDRNRDFLPNNGAVGDYKANYLRSLKDMGLKLTMAYGNATTDIYAYNQAEVPLERTFILGENGGQGGTQALGEGYTEHLGEASAEALPEQPFER